MTDDVLTIAGINATVIAIAVAVVAVILDRERAAIREAAARVESAADLINRLRPPDAMSVTVQWSEQAKTQEGRRAMVTRLRHLVWRRMGRDEDPPATLAEGADQACGIMSALVTAYPFVPRPPVLVFESPGAKSRFRRARQLLKRRGAGSQSETHGALIFGGVSRVEQWRGDLDGMINNGGLAHICGQRQHELVALLDAAAAEEAVARPEAPTHGPESPFQTRRPDSDEIRRTIAAHFCESVSSAASVLVTVSDELVRYRFRVREYPVSARIYPAVLGGVFVAGVIAPLLHRTTPALVYLWTPLAAYTSAVVAIAVAGIRRPSS